MARAQLDAIAKVAQQVSVLLAAGVVPASAWSYLDGVDAIGETAARGGDVATALGQQGVGPAENSAWRGFGAAWRVATGAGAPLAPTLERFATSLRSLADAQREADVALSGPIATTRLVMALPVVGVLFGMLLGFNTIGTLLTTGPGIACLVLGALLLLAGSRWNRRLVAAAEPKQLVPGLAFELMAIAVSGGGSLDRARATVVEALATSGFEVSLTEVDRVLDLSRRAGVPAAALLRAEAEEERREARAAAQKAAAVLAVKLMLPLGLCVLPAFMVLAVAPMVIAVISSTVASF